MTLAVHSRRPLALQDPFTGAPPSVTPTHSWVPPRSHSAPQETPGGRPRCSCPRGTHWGWGGAQARKETPLNQAGSGSARAEIPIQRAAGVQGGCERQLSGPGPQFPRLSPRGMPAPALQVPNQTEGSLGRGRAHALQTQGEPARGPASFRPLGLWGGLREPGLALPPDAGQDEACRHPATCPLSSPWAPAPPSRPPQGRAGRGAIASKPDPCARAGGGRGRAEPR